MVGRFDRKKSVVDVIFTEGCKLCQEAQRGVKLCQEALFLGLVVGGMGSSWWLGGAVRPEFRRALFNS